MTDSFLREKVAYGIQVLAIIVVLVGMYVRVAWIAEQEPWMDEISTLTMLKGHSPYFLPHTDFPQREAIAGPQNLGALLQDSPSGFLEGFRQRLVYEGHPPLYFIATAIWGKIFGTGIEAIRWFSAICSIAVIPLAYVVGRDILNRETGVVCAALVASNPFLVYFAQEARMYSMMLLVSISAMALCVRMLALEKGRQASWRGDIYWLGAVCLVGIFTHYFFFFVMLAIWALLWIQASSRRRDLYIVGAVVVVVVCVTILPLLIEQVGARGDYIWPRGDVPITILVFGLLAKAIVFCLHPGRPEDFLHPTHMVVVSCALIAILMLMKHWRSNRDVWVFGLTWFLVISVAPITLDVFVESFVSLVPRYSISAALGLFVLVASGLVVGPFAWSRFLTVVLVVAQLAVATGVGMGDIARREKLISPARYLNEMMFEGDLLVALPPGPWSIGLASYLRDDVEIVYFQPTTRSDSLVKHFASADRYEKRVQDLVRGRQRVWVAVRDPNRSFDLFGHVVRDPPTGETATLMSIANDYSMLSEKSFRGARVYSYGLRIVET